MWYLAAIVLGCAVLLFFLKPRDRGGAHDEYFSAINKKLKEHTDGTPKIFCDLDRLDRNIYRILKAAGNGNKLRIVTKSLPCIDMLKYIMDKTGTNRLMCFHAPFIPAILAEIGYNIDILLGKPLPAESAGTFFNTIPKKEKAASAIQWLVDTPERLAEYKHLAEKYKLRIRVNIELDIGLNRGGVTSTETLHAMFEEIRENPGHLVFSGFMGYEGHVPHGPSLFNREGAVRRTLVKSMDRYRNFCRYAEKHFNDLYSGANTFNSGGSGTFRFFTDEFPVTGIAVGGAFLRPAGYPAISVDELEPAIFIAAPVIKKPGPVRVPFVEFLTPLLTWWNPNMKQSFSAYGGGWAGKIISPPGIDPLEMLNDPPNQNLLPNQTLLSVSERVPLDIGDNIFYWPCQSDAMFQFNALLTIRGGAITGEWKTFPFGF